MVCHNKSSQGDFVLSIDTTIDNLFYVSIELGISAANSTHTAVVHMSTLGDRVRTRFNRP